MNDLEVELKQFGELDLDEIRVNGRRIGFAPHCENAVVRFVRLLKPAEAKAVHEKVAELRRERNMPPLAERTMQAPDPAAIRAAAAAAKKGKSQP
jgi:hypothetical protein